MKGGSIAVLAVAVTCLATPRLNAQTVEVTPHVGMHMPVGLLLEGRDQTDNTYARRRQLGAISIGARVTLRATASFSLEGNGTLSPSLVAITDSVRTVDLGGRVLMGSLKAMYRFSEIPSGWSFWGGAGAGIVGRNGDGWNGTRGTTDAALVLAGKARLGKLNSSKAFILAIEDYVTRASFGNTNASAQPRIHHDVVYSFGMAIPLTK